MFRWEWMTMRGWKVASGGGGYPCGGLWVSAGVSVGREGVTNGWEADKRMDDSESLNPLIR